MTNTRERLIEVAQELFVKKGFKGTNVREVCQLASSNISSISYYFNGKEGLYMACLTAFGEKARDFTRKTLVAPDTHDDLNEKLNQFASHLMRDYSERPELLELCFSEIRSNDFQNALTSEGPFAEMVEMLERFFDQAKEKGLISDALDSFSMTSNFLGILMHAISSDKKRTAKIGKSLKDDVEYRSAFLKEIIEVFLYGAAKREDYFSNMRA